MNWWRPQHYVVLRVHLYLYHSGFMKEGTVSPYEKKYDAKLPKLYQIRERTDIHYSRRAQRAQIHEKRTFLSNVIWYSVLCYNSLQIYRLLMKEFPFPSLCLLKKCTEGQLVAVKCPKSLNHKGWFLKI